MGVLEELYQETLLARYRSPKRRGPLADATRTARGENPACGDRVELLLKLNGDRIEAARFEGEGCAVSQASADLMSEAIEGKTVDEALALARRFKAMVVEGRPPEPALGELKILAGVAKLPSRVKCATLAWNALESALLEER